MIYLDNASTTVLDPLILEEMMPYFTDYFQNPSSNSGLSSELMKKIENSRNQCADLINANSNEIIFTSGATEAINIALKGFMEENYNCGNHIITLKTEHSAVLNTCEYLETKGIDITYLNVNSDGELNLLELENSITKETALIAVMLVNNETGVIHNLKKISEIAHKNNVSVFCDATQAIGKLPVDVKELDVDMLCMSAHKINGPKGSGFLYVKDGITLTPLIHGGGQENNMRGGTYNSPLIIGLGKACEIAKNDLVRNQLHYSKLYAYFTNKADKLSALAEMAKNTSKVSNIINVRITNMDANIFIESNKEILLSNGSACTSRIIEGSHVLKAMGLSDKESNECIRISFGKYSTIGEIDVLFNQLEQLC